MSDAEELPYTTIEPYTKADGTSGERYWLHYQDKALELAPNEFSVVLSLLDEHGLDFADVEDEREALNSKRVYGDLDTPSLLHILFRLRRKVPTYFTDLHIPFTTAYKSRTRLLTTNQMETIRQRLSNPEEGVCLVTDECGAFHLFINKKEVFSRKKKWVKRQDLALFFMAYWGYPIQFKSEVFQRTWHAWNPGNKIENKGYFKTVVSNLRYVLRPAGWTLSESSAGRGASDLNHKLVPYTPDVKNPRRPKLGKGPVPPATKANRASLD